ncbi:pentafunctional AROM polypeptide [Pseudohyphozyma bogoriensis]|nr:pentafunctional AROM polypeptide [Pseudohyphozyma bogoriensis]
MDIPPEHPSIDAPRPSEAELATTRSKASFAQSLADAEAGTPSLAEEQAAPAPTQIRHRVAAQGRDTDSREPIPRTASRTLATPLAETRTGSPTSEIEFNRTQSEPNLQRPEPDSRRNGNRRSATLPQASAANGAANGGPRPALITRATFVNPKPLAAPPGWRISWAMHFSHQSPTVTFAMSFAAIIPLAALLGFATEELALRTSDTIGGLLNATFGNCVELIIAILALVKGELRIVQSSMLGSLLSNCLLVLGMCYFAGGLRFHEQGYGVRGAQLNINLLGISVAAIVIPVAFHAVLASNQGATLDDISDNVESMSHGIAICLLVLYGGYLTFQLWTHACREEVGGHHAPKLSLWASLALLVIVTVITGFTAEWLVDSIDGLTATGNISREFVALILLPLVGNHSPLPINQSVSHPHSPPPTPKPPPQMAVAVGSSVQISLFVIPLLICLGWIIGQPLTFDFDLFETIVLAHRELTSTMATPTPTHIDKVSILGTEIIHCGFHLIPYIVETVLTTLPASTYVLITDTNLAPLYLSSFSSAFTKAIALLPPSASAQPPRWLTKTIPPGEQSKSREMKAQLEDFLLANKCTRDTVVLAMGGGVVGDLVGFVCASFMRGIRYCQIPTTLLAMVDSAVGGKTAIDTPQGKNLIGAFYQPSYVFIDASFLESLPRREFVNGIAEVIKTAAIWDAEEFAKLESGQVAIHSAALGASTRKTFAGRTLDTRTAAQSLLLSVVRGSIATKSHIVTIDEKETGLRNLVNFGHSIGHAIEGVMTPDVLHGECVSVGMVLEAEVARSLGHLGNAAVGRLTRCLKSHGCPVTFSDPVFAKSPKIGKLRVDTMLDFMKIDKKNVGPTKRIVLLTRIGKTLEEKATEVDDDIIRRVLSPAIFVHPSVGKVEGSKEVKLATPGSKSISNRALVLAALGEGECKLSNLLHSDDTQVMMTALEDMKGAKFSWEDNGETLVVAGGKGKLSPPDNNKEVYLGNAGTASRFLTTVCALVAPDANATSTTITGNARMKQRPIGPLVNALRSNGTSVEYLGTDGCLPLKIEAATSGFAGGKIELAASVSSQYVSSILLCAPYAKKEVTLHLVGGAVISQPYIDITTSMMAAFGINVERLPNDVYRIPQGTYKNPSTYKIESDASSATYPLALAAITGTKCTVLNIGNQSLQGDARFAKDVLEPMGCTVEQTADETTVTGPPVGTLRALGWIDMEPMTDAFLTATALAAVATREALPGRTKPGEPKNATRIYGIANQRVKECDRIAAMRLQLHKFGVIANELQDDIQILGIHPDELKKGASVHCYDDHRVAMAFSVLASVPGGPGAVIEEKRCVEKTWPSWWDDLSAKLGVKIEGVELAKEEAPVKTVKMVSKIPRGSSEGSVFMMGMRGAGKTHIGKIGGAALGWPVVDADEMFQDVTGVTAKVFVEEHGWPKFRVVETQILKDIVETMSRGFIVSLGGGVIETAENRDILREYAAAGGHIVHIVRDIDEVLAYLNSEPTRPSLGEDLRTIYRRRQPIFHELSDFEFTNILSGKPKYPNGLPEGWSGPPPVSATKGSEDEVGRFFKFMTGVDTNRIDLSSDRGHQTHAVELALPSLTSSHPALAEKGYEQVIAGADAVEVRVDLLKPRTGLPTVGFVAVQLASIRQRSTVPIIYTVRTISQGGAFPDGEEDALFALLELGIKSGCEYVTVESHLDPERIKKLVKGKQNTKIIASYYDVTGRLNWGSEKSLAVYDRLSAYGDLVKIVGRASSLLDNMEMLRFRDSVKATKPLITYNVGTDGQLSRVLSPVLGPVTHPLLSPSSHEGAVTFAQVQTALHIFGRIPKKKFYLFGTPIAHSKSPLLHNTAFKLLGLPHQYGLLESATITDELRAAIRAPDFGGASVTIPHKLAIIPFLDEISPEGTLIGAVNTIVPFERNGQVKLRGTNTDWIGLRNLVEANLSSDNELTEASTALVLGAGGTCRAAIYALHQVGFKLIYLFNRTLANAEKVAQSFPSEYNVIPITSLDAFPGEPPAAVISTIPAEGTSTEFLPNPTAGVSIPISIFQREHGGVLVDAAYKPKRTPLIDLAERVPGWKGIPGIMMLIEQGIGQCLLWTERNAPTQTIGDVVLEAYDAGV